MYGMKVSGEDRKAMSSVQVLSIFLILVLAASAVVYLDTTQVLKGEISNLQSQVNALQSRIGTGLTNAHEQPQNNARIAPTTRHIALVAEEAKIMISTDVAYDGWTFNGTVPGPTIMVNQGDTIDFKLINNFTGMKHSIDFHAAEVDWSKAYASIAPGETKTFNFTANYPGVFMYHCGTPPVIEHIGNGMYGAIIVNPITPLPLATGGEYVLVQSEFYLDAKPGTTGVYAGNYTKMLAATPDYVVFNGKANQYAKSPLPVQPNQLVRLYVLNAGPNHWSAFHVIGAIIDTVYIDGNPTNVEHGLQTLNIPPSGGAIVDMYFRDPGGRNPFVTHDFADASKGAVGMFVVENGQANSSASTSHSTGTSSSVSPVHVSIIAGAGTNTSSLGYSPSTITVVIGVNNTIVWTNEDGMPHTVTEVNKIFDSGNMNSGDSFTYTFSVPGTYLYYCAYHIWMKGTVIVKPP